MKTIFHLVCTTNGVEYTCTCVCQIIIYFKEFYMKTILFIIQAEYITSIIRYLWRILYPYKNQ
jgi:hypothetical protein